MKAPPHTSDAERSVLTQIMARGEKVAGQLIGALLEPKHFYSAAHRAIYEQMYENYYAGEQLDAITIGQGCSHRLAQLWHCEPEEVITRVKELSDGGIGGDVISHARIIKSDFDKRQLLQVAAEMEKDVEDGELEPEEIGARASHAAMRVATNTLLTQEIISFGDQGRRYVKEASKEMAAHQQGIELGAYFGLGFLDDWTRGIRPSELMFLGGEPGVGKTAVIANAMRRFAERQMKNPAERRIGGFWVSLEMGEMEDYTRTAQSLTKIDGSRLREARQSKADMQRIIQEWGRRKEIPLYANYSSTLRASQLRALIVEAIRRHNTGLVVIDHFRYFDMDKRYRDANQEDEEKARFLKESIAKDLNVAVICLAHTTKAIEAKEDRRPTLSHLRGSGQVAAHADFVAFMYRPYMHASEMAKNNGQVMDTDAEMIWRKNRYNPDGVAPFYFEPHTMTVGDPR